MRFLISAALAATVLIPAAALADTVFSDDFQNYSQAGWASGPKGSVGTSEYKGNISLRLTGGATATKTTSTLGLSDITIKVSFAALDLGAHGGCFLEVSSDDGANWEKVYRIGKGDADGVILHTDSKTFPELTNLQKITLRLNNSGPVEANCWADNISVVGTPTGGPRAPGATTGAPSSGSAPAPQSGMVVWDPNAPTK